MNCTSAGTFTTVIRRSLGGLRFAVDTQPPGFVRQAEQAFDSLAEYLPADGELSPDEVAELLSQLPPFVVLVIDEFDPLPSAAAALFSDLVKSLSDRSSSVTVVLVGVATSVDELLANHASISRCLRQVPMGRMEETELQEIIEQGYASCGFSGS